MRVTIVRELSQYGTRGACLVKRGRWYYVVSSTEHETLVFRANADGEITDWFERLGARSREEAIERLSNVAK